MYYFQAKLKTLHTEKWSQPKYWMHYYDGISSKIPIFQLVHHTMKSGWNMLPCNLMPFMHSTVLHTWFHKNCRQCALSLVCCSKSYQQSAPQDTINHWSNDVTVNVISTLWKLHNYILYTHFFYKYLSDQFSKHMTENLQSISILHLFMICINYISKASSDYTSQNKLCNWKTGCISDDTHQTWITISTWETSQQSGLSSTSNFSHH